MVFFFKHDLIDSHSILLGKCFHYHNFIAREGAGLTPGLMYHQQLSCHTQATWSQSLQARCSALAHQRQRELYPKGLGGPVLFRNLFFLAFFFGCACSIQTFPGQESNPHHSSENTGSSTRCAAREIPLQGSLTAQGPEQNRGWGGGDQSRGMGGTLSPQDMHINWSPYFILWPLHLHFQDSM